MSTNLNINTNTAQRKALKAHATFLLTSTGDGTGVSTITLTVSENMTLSLDGVGKFYTDAGGTLGESSTWDITTGAARTMYIKVTSGTSNLSIPKNKITEWNVWTSSANAVSIGGDVGRLTALTTISIIGSNTISGDVSKLINLTEELRIEGSTTVSGSITGLTSLTTRLYVRGSNTISGSISGIVGIHTLRIEGANTVSGLITGLTSLTFVFVSGSNTIAGDLNPIVSDVTFLVFTPCAMTTYSSGATWGDATITINPSVGYGYDATEIDNMLIDMAASVALISKTITLQGSNAARTAASDAAVTTLEGVGRTCTVVTNP